MDWERAKNALIILFFILNVFLLALVVQAKEGIAVSGDVDKKVRQILLQNNINVLCQIPSETVNNKMLTYSEEGFDIKKIESLLGENIVLNEEGMLLWEGILPFDENTEKRNMFLNLIKRMGLSWANFYMDEENADNMLFRGKYKNYLVFENYISFYFSDEGIIKIEAKAKKITQVSESNQKAISVNAILIKLCEKYENVDITAAEPGFINFAPGIDSTKRINDPLVWRITLSTGEKRIFRALDGAAIE